MRISARINTPTDKVDPIFYILPHVNWMKIITFKMYSHEDEVQQWHDEV